MSETQIRAKLGAPSFLPTCSASGPGARPAGGVEDPRRTMPLEVEAVLRREDVQRLVEGAEASGSVRVGFVNSVVADFQGLGYPVPATLCAVLV